MSKPGTGEALHSIGAHPGDSTLDRLQSAGLVAHRPVPAVVAAGNGTGGGMHITLGANSASLNVRNGLRPQAAIAEPSATVH